MNIRQSTIGRAVGMLLSASFMGLALSTASMGATTPNLFILASHLGAGVDTLNLGNKVCTLLSKDPCQPASESGEAGGFAYAGSVAVNKQGDVYIADAANYRVQELEADGSFVSMFGWNVNKTKVEKAGSTQQEKDVCTAASHDVCQAGGVEELPGVRLTGPGLSEQLGYVEDVAVDPVSNNVYVFSQSFNRVEEFTETGVFVLMMGGEVNETQDLTPGSTEAQRNLCTLASGDVCKAGVAAAPASHAHGAFNIEDVHGDLLAVGGPQDLLYVGDEGRVQELKASGEWVGEISLAALSPTGRATAIAVDPAGDVFVADRGSPGVREYDPSGVLQPLVIAPTSPSQSIVAMALDPNGKLGIITGESTEQRFKEFAALYSGSGTKISDIAPPSGEMTGSPKGLAFSPADDLYVTENGIQEVEAYEGVVFAEVLACATEQVTATSAQLCGLVNPNGLATKGFFEYTPPPGSKTPIIFEGSGTEFVLVQYTLTELEPNETYHYKIAAEAVINGENLVVRGVDTEFHTTLLAPVIVGEPSASFVKEQSADLRAAVNPEHDNTTYHFEYAPCAKLAGCKTVLSTSDEESSQYDVVGTTQEIIGLAAATTYSYRLVAKNEAGSVTGPEGTFTTTPAPVVRAVTGPASAITATSATISGAVDPGGQPAAYTFELGIFQGELTRFGIVFSASTGTQPTGESVVLTGLQPGTTYAYRITIHSGYGTASGATETFTTLPLPSSVIIPPPLVPQLPIPEKIHFPKESHVIKCRHGFTRSKHNKCVRTKTKKAGGHGKKARHTKKK